MKSPGYTPFTEVQAGNATTTELFDQLESTPEGISDYDARLRADMYGKNIVSQKSVQPLMVLLRQFASGFTILLLISALLLIIFGEITDGIFIAAFVVINVVFGFFQEYRSERTAFQLRSLLVRTATVIRNGRRVAVTVSDIVPGDMVVLMAGDVVPADCRIMYTTGISVDESLLTGESFPVHKDSTDTTVTAVSDAKNCVFCGSVISDGTATVLVYATGRATAIGRIGTLVAESVKHSGFEERINKLSRFVMMSVIIAIALFVTSHIVIGYNYSIWELLLFGLALAIGVVPEGLPLVTTFSFSRGARLLAQQGVIVKRLSAVEDLGSLTVLCTDKTGTLTNNRMAVQATWGESESDILTAMYSCSDSWDIAQHAESSNSFESAVYHYNMRTATQFDELHATRIDYRPFTAARRSNAIMYRVGTTTAVIMRGAFEELLQYVEPMSPTQLFEINEFITERGQLGNRILAVIGRQTNAASIDVVESEKGYHLIGLVAFADEPKESSRTTIERARGLGVRVMVLSGDSKEVTQYVARRVGIIDYADTVITGPEFAAMNDAQQLEAIYRYHAFARLTPDQKYTIVSLLREKEQVGYMGDGVNDAPPLKRAHVGIAVADATAVACETADIILTRKELGSVVDGISSGRAIFANTVKYIQITMLSNMGNFIAMVIASFAIPFLPMLPIQILLLNLLTDSPMIALSFDRVEPADLARPGIFDYKQLLRLCITFGLISTLFDVIMFYTFLHQAPSYLQTAWFVGSSLTELVVIYSLRSRLSIMRATPPPRLLQWITVSCAVVCMMLPLIPGVREWFGFAAIGLRSYAIVLGIVVVYLATNEFVKYFYYRYE